MFLTTSTTSSTTEQFDDSNEIQNIKEESL
jgi:hypothetical protein